MNNLYYNNKKLKKIKNKRTQKTKKVWGWILTVLGAMQIPELIGSLVAGYGFMSALSGCLLFLLPGLFLLLLAKRRVDKWNRYEAIIDNMGNTPISLIAKKMGRPEAQVYSDLQEMIHSDFFIGPNYNIEAYVDAEHDMLVMSSGGKPLRPIPDLPKEEPKEEPAAQAKPKEEAKPDQAPRKEEELTPVEMIRKAIAETSDDEVRGYLYGLEGSVRRIDERMKADPQLKEKTSIRRLYKYYLPQILELIRKYQSPDTPAELKKQIRTALRTSADALSNIEADLLEKDQMDAEIDIETLTNMFAQDGLLGRGAAGGAPKAQAKPAGGSAQAAGGSVQAVGGSAAQSGGAQAAQAKPQTSQR